MTRRARRKPDVPVDDRLGHSDPLPARVVAWFRRDITLVLLDALVVLASYLVALVVRFEGSVPDEYWHNFWMFLPAALFGYLYLNFAFGLYGQMWRYASVREARRVLASGTIVGLWLLTGSELLGGDIRVLPLSVVALGAVFSLLGLGMIRFQSRLFAVRRRIAEEERTRVLLMGAGDAGAMVLRDILRHPQLGLRPVGLIDDDPRKVGRRLQGIPVLGSRARIPELAGPLRVDQVFLAIPSATSEVVRQIVALCEQAGVGVRVLPSIREVVGGRVTARDIRDLRIEDLLGRQLVEIDLESVRGITRDRRVLVTGAGGSIGSEIARQVLEFGPSQLVLLDRDEIHLHDLLTELHGTDDVPIALADIRDREHMLALFKRYRPEVVFHTAAHKHLPILETHPREAVLTNVLGTSNVAEAALTVGSGRFVLISTDKAVKPISVMGASKWLAEQIIWSKGSNDCAFSAVRFGNVIGSRGGVVQTFLKQVSDGGPVTVTDTRMARYFMSIEESVQLVLQAAALSRGGEVFTLEMGEPVAITELAREVIRLAGRVPGRDIEITTIGARPGEKLVEDLLDPDERPAPSEHDAITVSRPVPPEAATLNRVLSELRSLAEEGREDVLGDRLRALAARRRLVEVAEEVGG
jgi:FlaA1/EpsC-like NDP-sugar epimerase